MTTSNRTDSADTGRSLDRARQASITPAMVAARVAELRPAVEAGDGAAMLAALDQARAWWDAHPTEQAESGAEAMHLTHGWADLMELVAHAPAASVPALLAKARLADWHWRETGGDRSRWEGELARTLLAGLATLTGNDARDMPARA
jgi:hypothetical protein